MERAILPCVVLAACACAAGSGADRVGEIFVRLEVTHARTMKACGLGERHCHIAATSATAALRRLRSDLLALRVPGELAAAKRQWMESLELYAQANEALTSASCAGAGLDACVRRVNQAKGSLEGRAAAALGGVAAR